MTGSVIEAGGRVLEIGTVDPPAVQTRRGTVTFGPPADADVTKKFATSKVVGLIERVDVSLKGKDRVRVTGSLGAGGSVTSAGYTAERIIIVDSADDAPDRIPGDGICATGPARARCARRWSNRT